MQTYAYACAFEGFGVSLESMLFLEGRDRLEALWSVQQALRSGVFDTVVLNGSFRKGELDEVSLRRLQIEAERSRTTVWILSEAPRLEGAWAFALRLHVHRRTRLGGAQAEPTLHVRVLKQRWSD